MTEQANAMLIAELRGFAAGSESARATLMRDAADALEAAASAETLREMKYSAWQEGFEAGWAEHENPGPFVNDVWDAKTPNPYSKEQS